jgi:hypothetical protein
VVLFSIYAVIVWFAAARYRRQWRAFASIAAGVAGLVVIALFHAQLARWSQGRIYLPVLQAMLYPYIVLVALVGLYLSVLPRCVPATACGTCAYDLRGLGEHDLQGLAALVCPECGRHAPRAQAALITAVAPEAASSQSSATILVRAA